VVYQVKMGLTGIDRKDFDLISMPEQDCSLRNNGNRTFLNGNRQFAMAA